MKASEKKIFFSLFSLAILVMLSLALGSCGDNIQNAPAYNYWSGTIPNWTLGERNIEGHVMTSQYDFIAARGTISPHGYFSVSFISPPDSLLTPFSFISPICQNNLHVDPPDIKYAIIGIHVIGESSNVLGAIRKSNSDTLRAGMYEISTIYISGNVAITGSVICYSDTVYYNWKGTAGWNASVIYYTHIASFGNTAMLSNNEPPGMLSWRFRRIQ